LPLVRGFDDSVDDWWRDRVDQHDNDQAHQGAHGPGEPANESVGSLIGLFAPAIFFLVLALKPLTILTYLSRKV
jgi:hypothetical protein